MMMRLHAKSGGNNSNIDNNNDINERQMSDQEVILSNCFSTRDTDMEKEEQEQEEEEEFYTSIDDDGMQLQELDNNSNISANEQQYLKKDGVLISYEKDHEAVEGECHKVRFGTHPSCENEIIHVSEEYNSILIPTECTRVFLQTEDNLNLEHCNCKATQRILQLESRVKNLEEELNKNLQAFCALEERERRYRTLVHAANVMVWIARLDGEVIPWESSWEQYTGQGPRDYEGGGWLNAYDHRDRERVKKIWKCAESSWKEEPTQSPCWSALDPITDDFGEKSQKVLRYCARLWSHHDGCFKYLLFHAVPMLDESGRVKELVCRAVDVHSLMMTQKRLNRITQSLNLSLRAAQLGFFDWEIRTGKVLSDQRNKMLFGIDGMVQGGDEQEFDASLVFDRIHREDLPHVFAAINESIEKGTMYKSEFRVVKPDGTVAWMAGRGEPFVCPENDEKHLIGVNFDITAQKELQEEKLRSLEQLRQLAVSKQAEEFERERAKEAETNRRSQEEFVDTVCHEIRNPLVGVHGGVDMANEHLSDLTDLMSSMKNQLQSSSVLQSKLAEMMDLTKQIEEQLDCIRTCAEQQKVIVDDVLDFSKLTHRQMELVPVPFSIGKSFEHVRPHLFSPSLHFPTVL